MKLLRRIVVVSILLAASHAGGLPAQTPAATAGAAPTAAVENSGGYRGPLRNGIYPARGLLKKWPEGGPKLLWRFDALGEGWASATVVGDTVYCLGGAPTGSLAALDLETGKLKWKQPYGAEFTSRFNGTRATPTVSDGHVYFASGKKDERSIYCLDAQTGRTVWHVDGNQEFGGATQGWGYNESPLVFGDKVVFTLRSKDDKTPPIVALDKRTGKLVWKADPGEGDLSAGDCSVAPAGEPPHQILVDNLWRAIVALDPDTGKTLWNIEIDRGTALTPTYADGYLAVSKRVDGDPATLTVLKLDRDGRGYKELWSANVNTISQVVIVAGKLFAHGYIPSTETDKRGKPRKSRVLARVCYDIETGKLLKAEPAMDNGSIVAADGMVYVLEGGERHRDTPEMYLLRPTPDGFERAGSFTPVVGTKELWVSPTIAAARLLIRQGSVLSVYDLRPGLDSEQK